MSPEHNDTFYTRKHGRDLIKGSIRDQLLNMVNKPVAHAFTSRDIIAKADAERIAAAIEEYHGEPIENIRYHVNLWFAEVMKTLNFRRKLRFAYNPTTKHLYYLHKTQLYYTPAATEADLPKGYRFIPAYVRKKDRDTYCERNSISTPEELAPTPEPVPEKSTKAPVAIPEPGNVAQAARALAFATEALMGCVYNVPTFPTARENYRFGQAIDDAKTAEALFWKAWHENYGLSSAPTTW